MARPGPAILSTLWTLAASSLAAAATPSSPQTFEESVDVFEVEVAIEAFDRKGEPLRGLTREQFAVYDEGERREITSLEMVDFAEVESAVPGAWPRELPLASRRHFLLLFDLSFSTPTSLLKARTAAREFILTQLHPTDLAAVATFSVEFGAQLLLSFSPDRGQLSRAVDALTYVEKPDRRATVDPLAFMLAPPPPSSAEAPALRETTSDTRATLEEVQLETMQHIANYTEKGERQYDRSRVRAMARSYSELARLLDVVKGRKQVVLFSEGFDSRLLVGRAPTGDREEQTENRDISSGRLWLVDTDNRFGSTEIQNDLERMVEAFRRADCVIQAVDIGGLRAGGEARSRVRSPGQDTLFLMANETGGKLFKDDNDLGGQLARVMQRNSVSYVLTFAVGAVAPDGRFRRLRIEVDVPGATVSHRRGYYAPRPYRELHPLERTLLAADAIAAARPRDEIAVDVLVAAFRSGNALAYVPVILEIRGEDLGLDTAGGKAPVEIYAYVTDEAGEMKDFFSRALAFDVADGGPLLGGGLKYYGHFDLAAGDYLVRVLVRNGATGKTGVRTTRLAVPTFEESRAWALPPFAIEAPGRWFMLREPPPQGAMAKSVVYPFTLAGDPYVPAARPTLRPDSEAQFCLVAYNAPSGEVEIAAELIDANGAPSRPVTLRRADRTMTGIPGLDKWLLAVPGEGLRSGEYRLSFTLREPGTSQVLTTSSTPLVVVD